MAEFFTAIPLFPLVLTIGAFQIGLWCQKKWKSPLLNPILIAVVLVVAVAACLLFLNKGGEKNVWDFPAVGKGWINFPRFFKQLEEAGNNAPYSIEIEFTAAGPKDLEEVHQAVKDSAEYLIAQGYML